MTYTRNYRQQIPRQNAPATSETLENELEKEQCEEAEAECLTKSEATDVHEAEQEPKRSKRYTAVREIKFRDEPKSCSAECRERSECPEKQGKSFCTDEMLVLALAVLLIMEGGDELIVFALLFVLFSG